MPHSSLSLLDGPASTTLWREWHRAEDRLTACERALWSDLLASGRAPDPRVMARVQSLRLRSRQLLADWLAAQRREMNGIRFRDTQVLAGTFEPRRRLVPEA